MSWLYSQVLVEEYLGDISSDGEQSALSSGKPIPQAYLSLDKMTDFSRLSRFGMTFKPLTENLGEALLMSYREGFLAKTSPLLEKGQELTENEVECGQKWLASFVKYDPDSSLWRTHQCSLLGDLEEFSETWPQWGLLAVGAFLEQQMLERITKEIESGLSEGVSCEQNVEANQGKSCLTVSAMRNEDGETATVLWEIDGFGQFLEKKILLKGMSKPKFCQDRSDGRFLQAQSKKTSERLLRAMLIAEELASSSQRQEYQQQLCGEFADIVCELSQHIALAGSGYKWTVKKTAECWEQRMLEQTIRGTEFGLSEKLPTPQASDHITKKTSASWKAKGAVNFSLSNPDIQAKWPTPDANCGQRGTQPNWTPKRKSGQPAQYTINQAVRDKMLPTPTAHNAKECNSPSEQNRNTPTLATHAGGKLNPMWVEWLMGWPLGHTDLKPLETDKFPYARLPLGESLQETEP
jgi:hypothetical protein